MKKETHRARSQDFERGSLGYYQINGHDAVENVETCYKSCKYITFWA